MLKVIESGIKAAQEQMDIDEALLGGVKEPLVRFYDFTPDAITHGYFIKPSCWLVSEASNVGRRPTGGGLIFHDGDFSFTLALPPNHPLAQIPALDRYKIINDLVLKALYGLLPERLFLLKNTDKEQGSIDELCMANPTAYDLILGGKKVGGAAQRKNRLAFIHQCSLFLQPPSWERVGKLLLETEAVLPKLKTHSGAIFAESKALSIDFRKSLKQALRACFELIAQNQ